MRATALSAAARLALARGAPAPPPDHVEATATLLWCLDQQLPSVRRIAAAAGYRSPASVLRAGRSSTDLFATIIAREWAWVSGTWALASPLARRERLAHHAVALARVDRSLLRLPGLVCAAVSGVGGTTSAPGLAALVPLHALGAFAADDAVLDPERLMATARRLAAVHVTPAWSLAA